MEGHIHKNMWSAEQSVCEDVSLCVYKAEKTADLNVCRRTGDVAPPVTPQLLEETPGPRCSL